MTTIEEAIQDAGYDWLLRGANSPQRLRETIAAVNEYARQRLGDRAPDLSEGALVQMYARHPGKILAFLQLLGGSLTPAVLLMAFRILQGWEIQSVDISQQRQKDFLMRVVLVASEDLGEENEIYESRRIQDFAIFRHIGIMEIDGRPVFDGLYRLKI